MKTFLCILTLLWSLGTTAQTVTASELSFFEGEQIASVSISSEDKRGDENVMIVQWKDAQTGQPVEPEFQVELWHPEMNHGSAPTDIKALGQGRYQVSNMYFIMPGTWEIRLHLTKNFGLWRDMQFWSVTVDSLFVCSTPED